MLAICREGRMKHRVDVPEEQGLATDDSSERD